MTLASVIALAACADDPVATRNGDEAVIGIIGGPEHGDGRSAGPRWASALGQGPSESIEEPTGSRVAAEIGAAVTTDGFHDLVYQNVVTGDRGFVLRRIGAMTGSQPFIPLANVPLEWTIVGARDHDQDGMPDILWRNTTTGELGTWLLTPNVGVKEWRSWGQVPLEWEVRGLADLDGNSSPDIVWWNRTTNERGAWLLSGTAISGWVSWGVVPAEWSLLGACDATGSPSPDIMFYNTSTRQIALWVMEGTSIAAFQPVRTLSSTFPLSPIVGPQTLRTDNNWLRCGMISAPTVPNWPWYLVLLSESTEALWQMNTDRAEWQPAAFTLYPRTHGPVSSVSVTSAGAIRAGDVIDLTVTLRDNHGLPVSRPYEVIRTVGSGGLATDIIDPAGVVRFTQAMTCAQVWVRVEGRVFLSPCFVVAATDEPTALSVWRFPTISVATNTSTNANFCGFSTYQPRYRVLRADGTLARGATLYFVSGGAGVSALSNSSSEGTLTVCVAANTTTLGLRAVTVGVPGSPVIATVNVHVVAPESHATAVVGPQGEVGASFTVTVQTSQPDVASYEIMLERCVPNTTGVVLFGVGCTYEVVETISAATPELTVNLPVAGDYRYSARAILTSGVPTLGSPFNVIRRAAP